MVYKLFLPQYVKEKYKEWTNYIERAMEFVKNCDPIRVQMSPRKDKTNNADEWEVLPMVDDVGVS